jgi:hypothetical protein
MLHFISFASRLSSVLKARSCSILHLRVRVHACLLSPTLYQSKTVNDERITVNDLYSACYAEYPLLHITSPDIVHNLAIDMITLLYVFCLTSRLRISPSRYRYGSDVLLHFLLFTSVSRQRSVFNVHSCMHVCVCMHVYSLLHDTYQHSH